MYRRFVELLFDAKAKAKEDLAMQMQRNAEALPEELELVPREQDGRTVLVLSVGQHEYVFERAN